MDESRDRNEGSDADRAKAPEMPMVYANTAGIRAGAFDVLLEFGFVVPAGQGEGPPQPDWDVRVAMSWEHARALQQMLATTLDAFEEQVGGLPDLERLRGPA